MNVSPTDSCILDWSEGKVQAWLSSLGYSQYEYQIREHKITGDVLCILDADGLKALGVSSAGQRLCILRSIYQLKLAQNVPIDPEHYAPPSATHQRSKLIVPEELRRTITDQRLRLISLERENQDLKKNLQHLWESFNLLRTSLHESEDRIIPSQRTHSDYKNLPPAEPRKLSIGSDLEMNSHRYTDDEALYISATPFSSTMYEYSGESLPFATPPLSINKHRVNLDNLKRFKVSLDDPTWKVLPAALQRYKISSEQWSNYAMFICYGSAADRKERRLSDEEKPLDLFQKLREARKNPVCVLKHVKKPTRTRNRPGKLPLRSPATAAI